MKICMVSDDFLPAATGVGTHLQVVLPDLVMRGYDISIITTRRPGEPEIEVWKGVKVYRVPTIKVFGFYQAIPSTKVLESILKAQNFDIIHYHYLSIMMIKAYKVAKKLNLKHYYTYHMTIDHLTQPLPMKPFRRLFFKLHVKYCNLFQRILVPSAKLVDSIKEYGIKTPSYYLSNPVDFSGDEAQPIDPQKFTVFYAGRLNPEKNIPFLIRSFAKLAAKYPDQVVLRIGGRGSQRSALESLCKNLKIQNQVQFLGFLNKEELAKEYARCSVFVLPSLVETQGLVAMEAMRFNKPVIVADSIVSAPELVDNGENGFIVKSNDIEELCHRLIELKENPTLRHSMGFQGRSRSSRYTPSVIIDELEKHYEESFPSKNKEPLL